jgi:UDP-N-acetyl-D-galactosamine dehydrogenase
MVQKTKIEDKPVVCVVGLGYVGLPLALAFGRTDYKTFGFDINSERIAYLRQHNDSTGELTPEELASSNVIYTHDPRDIKKANFIIVAVPTPITQANQPELRFLDTASETVGSNLQAGAIVVYESTVYPGLTEDFCAPILEHASGLKRGTDFKIGYSPERINPGDKEHTLERIVKVVSGEDSESLERIASVYETVCGAGVYRAANIKTAEAAKVIENTQRDLNIALVNELSLIFHRMGIDTQEVLEAAGTKWNFLKFKPGLVGGHCIGVDPYYLVHKAEELGYHPQVIAAGRRVNDFMPEFVAQETIRGLIAAGKNIQKAKVLIMGLTFKENVKDVRNSKISATIAKLQELGVNVVAYDPLLTEEEIIETFDIPPINMLEGQFDAVIVATPHSEFNGLEETIAKLIKSSGVIMDIKKFYPMLRKKKHIIYMSL